jgi:hypothetical protein
MLLDCTHTHHSDVNRVFDSNQLLRLSTNICRSYRNVMGQVVTIIFPLHKTFLWYTPIRKHQVGSDKENMVAKRYDPHGRSMCLKSLFHPIKHLASKARRSVACGSHMPSKILRDTLLKKEKCFFKKHHIGFDRDICLKFSSTLNLCWNVEHREARRFFSDH